MIHPARVASYRSRVWLWPRRGSWRRELGFSDGWLEIQGDLPVPEELTLTTADVVEADGSFVSVEAEALLIDGTTEITRLGTFVVADVRPAPGGGREVSALGLLHETARCPMGGPTSPLPGATILQELERLVDPHTPIDYAGPLLTLPRGIRWGTDRLEAVHDLCSQHGLRARVRHGRLVVAPVGQPTGVQVVLGSAWTRVPLEGSTLEIPSSVVVVGNSAGAEGTEATQIRLEVHSTSGRFDTACYGWTREIIDAPTLRTHHDLRAHGQQVLASRQAQLSRIRLETAAFPGLALGDEVLAERPDAAPISGTVAGFSMPLISGPEMTIDLER